MSTRVVVMGLVGVWLWGVGCVDPDEGEFEGDEFAYHDHGHDHLPQGWVEDPLEDEGALVQKRATCANRWSMPPDTSRVAAQQRVSYDNTGSRCAGGATQGATTLGNYLRDRFGRNVDQDVVGRGVQIYNCRSINGGRGLSLHAEGRAVDLFIPMVGRDANNSLGDPIANWLVENAQSIGVQMIIWDKAVWLPNRASQTDCYNGRNPHTDHLHIELSREAAARATPFFRDLAQGNLPDGDNVEPAPPASFVGSACRRDEDCDFSSGVCFRAHSPSDGVGFCTQACEGFCPDRGGFATTFCASSGDLGAEDGGGFCVSRASSLNDQCGAAPNLSPRTLSRYVGRSGATRADAEVCAPRQSARPAPQPEPQPEGDVNGGVCRDVTLPLTGHGWSCDGFGEGFWRCGCDGAYGTSVSQVCRDGRWVNYQTNPRDCSRCVFDYSGACEGGGPDQSGQGQAPPQGNGGVCDDPALPAGEHNDACTDTPGETWRCACSERLAAPISQVCRGGRWVSYETNPRDCARCNGSYSSGCEAR